MRYALCLAAFAATTLALPASTASATKEVFTIELEGGERRQVTETEKFALKAVSPLECHHGDEPTRKKNLPFCCTHLERRLERTSLM